MPDTDFERFSETQIAGFFRHQLEELHAATEAALLEAEKAAGQAANDEGERARLLPPMRHHAHSIRTQIAESLDDLTHVRLDKEMRAADVSEAQALLEEQKLALLASKDRKDQDREPLREASAGLARAEHEEFEQARQAIDSSKEAFYEVVREGALAFWDVVIEYEQTRRSGPKLAGDLTASRSLELFEDGLIRWGWPLEFDTTKEWKVAAQEFVPGLHRLITCTRTARRRRGLKVLQRTLKDTEVGLYDGVATADDLELMNKRRQIAGHALVWLLRQPCPPCRPTDALRREIDLALTVLATSPMGDPNDRYVDDYEEQELISSVPSPHQAPPDANPGVADPRLIPLPSIRGFGGDTQMSDDLLGYLRGQYAAPPIDYGLHSTANRIPPGGNVQ